jgi:hypothetical protein
MTNIEKLKIRRGKDPILDYYGNPYQFKKPDPPPPLSEMNKMELLNMSTNNRWFLFVNRMSLQLIVYELVFNDKLCNLLHATEEERDKSPLYEFVPVYQIDYDKTSMF